MSENKIKQMVQNMSKQNADALLIQIEKDGIAAGMSGEAAHKAGVMFVIDAWLGKTKYN